MKAGWSCCSASVALAVCAFAGDLQASLSFCNKTDAEVSLTVALAKKGPENDDTRVVRVRGWWKLAPTQCATVSQEDASSVDVYYHGHGSDVYWGSRSGRFCVRPAMFDREQVGIKRWECPEGFRLQDFSYIRTSTKDSIENLTRKPMR